MSLESDSEGGGVKKNKKRDKISHAQLDFLEFWSIIACSVLAFPELTLDIGDKIRKKSLISFKNQS